MPSQAEALDAFMNKVPAGPLCEFLRVVLQQLGRDYFLQLLKEGERAD
jgi:hypothetical protein